MARIAEVIRDYRTRNGLTRRQLGESMGVSPSHLANIENADIGLRSELIGRLKEPHPELWRELVSMRLADERAALRVGTEDEEGVESTAVTDALRRIREEIDRKLHDLGGDE